MANYRQLRSLHVNILLLVDYSVPPVRCIVVLSSSISKNNFHSGRITPASRQATSAPCVLCALAVWAFFAYHVLCLMHPSGPFSFPKRQARLSRPILSHHCTSSYLFVPGVPCTPTKLSTLGTALAPRPPLEAWICQLASQNASFVVCPTPPFNWHEYCSMKNSLVVTIC